MDAYVVVDDSAHLEALTSLLRSVGLAPTCFCNETDFLDSLGDPAARTGCVFVDLRRTESAGLALQQRLVELESPLALIFISAGASIRTVATAMKAGAIDFLEMPVPERDFFAALAAAAEATDVMARQRREAKVMERRLSSLSRREDAVCRLVCAGLLNKQIAFELGITESSVKVYRKTAMRKLGARSFSQFLLDYCPAMRASARR